MFAITFSDTAEKEKLNVEEGQIRNKEQEDVQSAERLSLMIRFNHRGSLTSLDRGSRAELSRNSRRNSSLVIDHKANSGSKVDLLKSALEVNLKRNSSPHLNRCTVAIKVSYILK